MDTLPDEQLTYILKQYCTELEYGTLRFVSRRLHRLCHKVMCSFTDAEKCELYIGFFGNNPNDPVVPALAVIYGYQNIIEWAYSTGLFGKWRSLTSSDQNAMGFYIICGGLYKEKSLCGWLREHNLLSGEMEMSIYHHT